MPLTGKVGRHLPRIDSAANTILDEMRRLIVDWLKAGEDDAKLDMRMDLRTNLDLQQVGTCTWLYDNPTFKAWHNATSNAAVWYHAGPGAGKTILSSVLTKYLQDQGLKTAYFFYSFNDPSRRKAITAIRSLALQLLTQSDTIPDSVLRLYETEVANRTFTLRDHHTIALVLQALLKQSSRIHVILDGLDECYDRSLMRDIFVQLMSAETYGLVKWFFTSRNEPDLRSMTRQVGASEIVPSPKVIMGDIKKYLQDHMAGDHSIVCIDQWTTASEGNFLWIHLMLRILTGMDLTCDEDIEEELEKFPKGLTGCYLRSLQQLSLRSKQHQELAR